MRNRKPKLWSEPEPILEMPDFSLLSPADVADAAEAVLEIAVDGTLVPYPSYVNRVYGLNALDGRQIIAKFYRPDRWSESALREEHGFVAECAAARLPVLAPIADPTGETLSAVTVEGPDSEERTFFFALYPFVRGRGWEPETDEDWLSLGRLIASLHGVGIKRTAPSRPVIHPDGSTRPALRRLMAGGYIHPETREDFGRLCEDTLDRIAPLFADASPLRLHGDLHRGNALRDIGGPLLIDFDDMATGPAIQDLWLFLPGRITDSRKELALLLEGYEEIRPFDRNSTILVEPLRFMRMVSYLDWQARQHADAGFLRAFPDWGSRAFWIKEYEDLCDQARVIAAE